MCNNDDKPWNTAKKNIANNIKELTLLWNIGVNERNLAHKNGTYSWDKIKNNEFQFGEKKKNIVQNIIKINKEYKDIIYPGEIKDKNTKKILKQDIVEYYVDFESINDLSVNKYNERINSMTFMIGCLAVINKDGKKEYIFKDYTVDYLEKKEESRIFKEWIKFMNELNIKFKIKNPKIFHWGCAEKILLSKAYKNQSVPNVNFTDLLLIFKNIPITIKGVFDFSLKNISKALYKHGLIKNTWENNTIDGREAMVYAWLSNEISNINKKSMKDMELIKDIQKYNYVDCKVVEELTNLLRYRIHFN